MLENPPLEDVYLEHFGVRGMHWGIRRKRPDEKERKETFQKASRNKKIAIGLAVVGGAAAIAFLLTKRGRTKVGSAAFNNVMLERQRQTQVANNPFGDLAQKFRTTKASSIPSPEQMIAEARMASVRDRVLKTGNQSLTERTWRDAANLRRQAKNIPPDRGLADLNEVRRRLADPNYDWQF